MRRTRWALMVGLLTLAGCSRSDEILAVVHEKEQAIREVTAVLAKIHDEKDMAAAKEELDDRYAYYEKIARKARDLPRPPPPEAGTPLGEAVASLQQAIREMQGEVARVKELRGGEKFLAQFGGSLP